MTARLADEEIKALLTEEERAHWDSYDSHGGGDVHMAYRHCAAERKMRKEAEAQYAAVADALGYVNYAEGQDGREVAGPEVIVRAFRWAEAERNAACEDVARLRAEVAALRRAADEVLSWNLNDTSALLSNPPQNAALFHAQRVLRDACRKEK